MLLSFILYIKYKEYLIGKVIIFLISYKLVYLGGFRKVCVAKVDIFKRF